MSLKSRFFVGRLQKNCGMKENDYPNIDEERGLDLPHTIIELKAELKEADCEMDAPDKWCTFEQMWAEIRQAFPWATIK